MLYACVSNSFKDELEEKKRDVLKLLNAVLYPKNSFSYFISIQPVLNEFTII
jgi:hypothetical protein